MKFNDSLMRAGLILALSTLVTLLGCPTGSDPKNPPPETTTYTVTYNGNNSTGGTAPIDTASYAAGAAVTVLGSGDLVKTGKVFLGWAETSDAATAAYISGSPLTMPANNVTLYAIWTAEQTYTVTFETNGGTSVGYQNVVTGSLLSEPTSPIKPGFTFNGWYKEAALSTSWSFTVDTVTSDRYLYAKWTAVPTYTVTYNGNGKTAGDVPADSTGYVSGASVTVLDKWTLERTGYNFLGWAETSAATTVGYISGAKLTMPASNVNLYAVWTEQTTYIVSFNSNGGSSVSLQNVITGYKATEPVSPSRTGFTFDGWYKEAAFAASWSFTADTVTGTTTLYAKWTAVPTYTVTYNGNGKTAGDVPTYSTGFAAGTSVTILGAGTLAKTDNIFLGWAETSTATTVAHISGSMLTMPANNVTLYALWTALPTFIVSFNSNNGTTVGSQNVISGHMAVMPASPSRTGYVFSGWFKEAALSNAWSFTADTVTGSRTLYAKWTAVPTYTVAYYGNGSTGGTAPADSSAYVTGASATVLQKGTLVKTDNIFLGWAETSTETTVAYISGSLLTMPANNVTLYAVWTALPAFIVSFNSNSGSSVGSQNVISGQMATLPVSPSRTGFTFSGWFKEAALSTPWSFIDDTVTVATTLYAKWTVNQYNLAYTPGANGTITGAATQTVNYGSSGTAVTAEPNSGYHFFKWSDNNSSVATRTDATVTGNISAVAIFNNQYQLTYDAGPNGKITGVTLQPVFKGENGTTVTAVPNSGYQFVQWSDGVLTAARTDTSVAANISVTATFAKVIMLHTVNYTAGSGGTISGNASQSVIDGLNGMLVTAVANTGYHFIKWSDNVTTAERTDKIVTSAISVSASFGNTFAYSAGTNGTISGTSPQTVNYGSSGTAVTAVANTGYHFVKWSDGLTTAARTDLPGNGNISVTAGFAADGMSTLEFSGTAEESIDLSGIADQSLVKSNGDILSVTVAGTYSAYQWYIDGVRVTGTAASYILDSSVLSIDVHNLSVIVTLSGVPYSKQLRFRVVY